MEGISTHCISPGWRKIVGLVILALWVFAPMVARAELGRDWQRAGYWQRDNDTPAVEFNGKMLIVGGSGQSDVWSSIDGEHWKLLNEDAPFGNRSEHTVTVFGGKLWVIGGHADGVLQNDVWCSTDGSTWFRVTEHAGFTPRYKHSAVSFDGKLWVIGGRNQDTGSISSINASFRNDVWRTTDGVTWTRATEHATFSRRADHSSFVHDGKMWVIAGTIGAGIYGNAMVRIASNDVWSSTDGINWTKTADSIFPRRSNLSIFELNGKMWICGGASYHGESRVGIVQEKDNPVADSLDDKVWVPIPHYYYFEVSDYQNDVWCSSDGVNWSLAVADASFGDRQNQSSLIFDGRVWTIGGSKGNTILFPYYSDEGPTNDVWKSEDGYSWNPAVRFGYLPDRREHASVVYDEKMWVIGGYVTSVRSDIWYSSDGIKWIQATNQAPFKARSSHSCVVYDGKMWVIGGYTSRGRKNDVWYSTDGINWIQTTASAAFTPRTSHASVVYDGKMWVIGGYDGGKYLNDIWYSTDGVTWIEATASAAFSPRYWHTSVVFDDQVWVIGGYSDDSAKSSTKNDVWYSTDGFTWTEATANAAFPTQSGHACLVFDNKMWLIGGSRHDVWSSVDGVNWNQVADNPAYPAQWMTSSVVFENKIWNLCGGITEPEKTNNVWYTEISPTHLLTLTDLGEVWGAENFNHRLNAPEKWAAIELFHDAANGWQTFAGDTNGDGVDDLISITEFGEAWIAENTSDKSFAEPVISASGYLFDEASGWAAIPGDYNGDGVVDLAQITDFNNVWLGLNAGNSIPAPTFVGAFGITLGSLGVVYDPANGYWGDSGDVNGDGKDDLVFIRPNGQAYVLLSKGAEFDPPRFWGTFGFRYDRGDATNPGYGLAVGDFNDDGKDDLACVTPYGDAWVALSNGVGFNAPTRWGWLGFKFAPRLSAGWDVMAGDMNGDEVDDLVQVSEFGDVWVAQSLKSSFDASVKLGSTGFHSSPEGPWKTFVGKFK